MQQRILVFQTAFLGDAVLSIPLLKALRGHFPDARLGLVCRDGLGEFFEVSQLVHQSIEVNKKDKKSLIDAYRKTREFRPSLIISPHQSFRTAAWVRRLGAKKRIGFRTWWNSWAFTNRVLRPLNEHDVLRQLSLMRGVGVDPGALSESVKSLLVSMPEIENGKDLAGCFAIAPGSQWATKEWTEEGYTELARILETQGKKVVLVGTQKEKDLCGRIQSKVKSSIDLSGQTSIVELAQYLKQARVLICNDSGTMHVATAVGTPVVSIFGPTVPSQGYAPWGRRSRIVEVNLKCRPCGAHGHDKCPIGTHECMRAISPTMVFATIEELIK